MHYVDGLPYDEMAEMLGTSVSAVKMRALRAREALAVALGIIFLGIQAFEWYELLVHKGFGPTSGTFGTSFYGLTGFHGFHVIIGAIFLAVITYRVAIGHFTAKKHFAMTAAGWYWHFVDVVWIILVAVLYLWAH